MLNYTVVMNYVQDQLPEMNSKRARNPYHVSIETAS